MALNGILSSALSALNTNAAALRVVSNNIANVNTPDYARRKVELQTLNGGGHLAGVDIADVRRVVDQYLGQESLSATAGASQYDSQSAIFDQINALLGSPGDGSALTSKLSNIFGALGQAALSPTTAANQNNVVNAMQDLATSISSLSNSLSQLATQADNQIATSVAAANSLIRQIYDLNRQIKTAAATGDTDTAYLDERDTALKALAQQMDVRTSRQDDGSVLVSTGDGISLIGSTYAQLAYGTGSGSTYQPIALQDTDPQTGKAIGTAQNLDQHLTGGALKGLIDMRDGTLTDLRNELGSFAQGVSQAFNQVSNANSAYPPPYMLSGRQTGLLAGDSLNFTGKTTVAITDSNGVLQHRVDINFDAGTIAVDGGAAAGFTKTIDGLAIGLTSAMSVSAGSASFVNGRLTLSAYGHGLVVSDTDASHPSERGGTSFSQFFGLNDVFQSSAPSILNMGAVGGDSVGLASDGEIDLVLRGPNGEIAKTAKVTITAGMSFNQSIMAINTAFVGYGGFDLQPSDGSSVTPVYAAGYNGYQFEVADDTTERGNTGVSLTELLGVGANHLSQQASGFSLTPALADDSSLIPLAKPDFSTGQIVGAGDSSGLMALQNLATSQHAFAKAGSLAGQTTTLGDYGAAFYQDAAIRSSDATTNKTTQDDRLTEAQTRLANNSGVSLDEELSNLMMYQQAYSAGARMLTVVGQLYDTLLQIV